MGVFNGKAEYIEDNRNKVQDLTEVDHGEKGNTLYPSANAVWFLYQPLSEAQFNLDEKMEANIEHIEYALEMGQSAVNAVSGAYEDIEKINNKFTNEVDPFRETATEQLEQLTATKLNIEDVDDSLSEISENPVQNKIITKALAANLQAANTYAYGVASTAKNYADLNFANTLKGKASGCTIALNDISPMEHNVSVKLKNENLAVYPYDGSYESHGITWTDNGNGAVQAVGTSTGYSQFWLTTTCPFEDGKTYAWTTYSVIELVLLYTDATGVAKTAHGSITWSDRYTFKRLYLQVAPNNTVDAQAFPTINEGTTTNYWTPYMSDFSTTNLKVFGKNILPPLIRDEYSAYGITFTFREDGKVVLNGTSTDNIIVKYPSASICLHPGITYTIGIDNPDWSFGNSSFFVTYIDGSGTTQRFRADGENRATFTWDESYSELNIFIQVAPDKTFNNVVIAPQIEVGTAQTGYEPYKMTEYSPNADGTVEGVVSISPNMTLCSSDGLGVIVEAEYSKDTNKVVEKLMQAIISLGGNV